MKYSLLSKYRSELMGIAMIAVMLFHANDMDLKLNALNTLRSWGFGGVDIFVLLSGLGLAMSLARREQEYGSFMARRCRRLLPAYYAVMVPYTVCLFIVNRATLSTFIWNGLILNYWVRPAGSFNWYITGILIFYAAAPIAFRVLNRMRHPALCVAAVIALSVAVAFIITRDGYWWYLDVFYRIPVFAVGLLLGIWISRDKPFTWRDGVFWAALLLLGAVYYRYYRSFDFYLPLCHLFLFTTVPICLALSLLFHKIPLGPVRGALRFLGENSLEIYLLNVSFFSERDFLRRFIRLDAGNYGYYAVTFALNILLGWVLHRIIAAVMEKLAPSTK